MMKKYVGLVLCLSMFGAGAALAGERLDNAALKEFFTGNTVFGEHFRHGAIRTYFAEDGTVTSVSDSGKERVGKWWIDGDKRCLRWDHKNKDLCHYVERNDDGSHTLIHSKKGKRLVEISKTEKGDHTQ